MEHKNLMLIGDGGTDGDYELLLTHEGKSHLWSCPKHASIGDTCFIYVTRPHSQVLAMASVIKPSRPGHEVGSDWRYVTRVGPIKLLPAPIPMAELRVLCPDWPWLRYPRAYAYIPPAVAKRLLRRAKLRTPPVENAEVEVMGAGFGDPESNRLVERAAVTAVKCYYIGKGFTVQSRERDRVGYDLDAERGRQTLHVEVKGVSNGFEVFPITEGEVNRSHVDAQFRLAVVTHARNFRRRQIRIYSGAEFSQEFLCRPLAYMARSRAAVD